MIAALAGGGLGSVAVLYAFSRDEELDGAIRREAARRDIRLMKGHVGSMQTQKVIAAVETGAKREGLVSDASYREEHALYHATVEALHGVGRGQLGLGEVLRTAGLTFAVARGPRSRRFPEDGKWLAVALYGTIGAPVRGFEHETLGLGINHI
ncbi:anti-terminator HutP [Limnochorda pilosa]|uniref:Hut operon positive regulatory protein n=1 Tax=Limnochorda pilosa TaxID=1555112 RepID=A0A0K2SGD4_LIMPI|nr:anti-terminator HutP [Limnochorda pilosa]